MFPADPLPFDLLKVADASIAFNGQKVVRGPATLDGLAVALDLAGGKLTISKIDAGLSGGKLAISGVIDGSAPQPAIALKLTSRGVEAGTLLQTFGQSAVLSGGKVDLDVDVKGQGESVRQIMAGLNGHTDMKMGSAKINNSFAKIMFADLFKLISTGGSADGSNLSCVVSKFDIAKGVATSKALVVDTSGATIIGSGKIMLDSEKLDMHLNPQAKQASLASLAIPVNVGGTLASPSVLPDAAGAAKGAVVGAVSGGGAVAGALTGLATGSGGGGGGAAASSGGCSATASMEAPATAAPAQQPAASKSQEGTEKTKGDVGKALKDLLP